MKNVATIRRMATGVGLMTACVISACGGGSGAQPAAALVSDGGGATAGTGVSVSVPASGVASVVSAASAASSASSASAAASSAGTSTTPPVVASPGTGTIAIDLTRIPLALSGSALLQIKATTEEAPAADGAFRTVCGFAHMSFDDPIVFPGKPGLSHLHTFFGNTGTDASSTAESLRNSGNSTCRGGIANRSAYWVPTMIDSRDNHPLVPDDMIVYYKNGVLDGAMVKPMPAGLRMIAGDPNASAPHPAVFSMRWKCIGGPNDQNGLYQDSIGNCDVGASLYQEVFFPQCWDGINLDSPDHMSHMSYTVDVKTVGDPRGWSHPECPATHPVVLPQIAFNIAYKVTEKDQPLYWRLASDNYDRSKPAGYSSHGDWFNGWKSDVSDSWAKNCIEAKKDCHAHLLGDGRMMF